MRQFCFFFGHLNITQQNDIKWKNELVPSTLILLVEWKNMELFCFVIIGVISNNNENGRCERVMNSFVHCYLHYSHFDMMKFVAGWSTYSGLEHTFLPRVHTHTHWHKSVLNSFVKKTTEKASRCTTTSRTYNINKCVIMSKTNFLKWFSAKLLFFSLLLLEQNNATNKKTRDKGSFAVAVVFCHSVEYFAMFSINLLLCITKKQNK